VGVGGLCFDWRLDYVNYHSGFNDLFRGKRLTGILSELMGEPAVLFKEKVSVPASVQILFDLLLVECDLTLEAHRSTTKKLAGLAHSMLTSMRGESSNLSVHGVSH